MVSVRVCVCLHILYTLYTMIQYPNIRPEMPIKMVVETEYMRVTNAYIYSWLVYAVHRRGSHCRH